MSWSFFYKQFKKMFNRNSNQIKVLSHKQDILEQTIRERAEKELEMRNEFHKEQIQMMKEQINE